MRRALATAIGTLVAWIRPLERPFVRAGRALSRRSRVAGSVYALAQDTLVARLTVHGSRYRETRIRNVPLWLDITETPARHAYFYGAARERAVADAVMTALAAGDVFVCTGTHAVFFAIVAARIVGSRGRVVVFEARDDVRSALAFAADRNDVEGIVESVPAALSDVERPLALPSAGSVTAVTLDGWLSTRKDLAERIRCVKIDVPGRETRILAGMPRALATPKLTIVCSTGSGSDADAQLTKAGFTRHPLERGSYVQGNFVYVRT